MQGELTLWEELGDCFLFLGLLRKTLSCSGSCSVAADDPLVVADTLVEDEGDGGCKATIACLPSVRFFLHNVATEEVASLLWDLYVCTLLLVPTPSRN